MNRKFTSDYTMQLVEVILDDLARRYQIPIGIYQLGEKTIFSKLAKKYFSPLCSELAKIPELKSICDADHNRRGNEANYAIVQMCHCGLFNFAMPIFLQEDKVGTLLCGQKKLTDPQQAAESKKCFLSFLEENKKYIKNPSVLKRAYETVGAVDSEFFETLKEELSRAAELIFKVFFERKIIEQQRLELERNITTIAHEIQIYVQGALGAVNEINYLNRVSDKNTISKINKDLEGMLNHIGSIVTNLVWSSTELVYTFCTVNILKILHEAIDHYRWFAKNRNIEIRFKQGKGSPKIMASEPHIKQLINNLLHNAIKYSFKGNINLDRLRYITVSAQAESSYYSVEFTNYGIGILEDEYKKILSERYRGILAKVENRSGTGLGLRIAMDIIHRHKGKIEIKSKPTEGKAFLNIFKIKLPYNQL